ncbi:hypothetical protein FACS1894137_17810 [Spirochaetia bacterium]|nr:hypothetical protein FACS1894137_17810 [Spirochaetia bacterium]
MADKPAASFSLTMESIIAYINGDKTALDGAEVKTNFKPDPVDVDALAQEALDDPPLKPP